MEAKTNLSTKSLKIKAAQSPISQNRYRLLRMQKVARNEKCCSKYEKLPKRCRATCGKSYMQRLELTLDCKLHDRSSAIGTCCAIDRRAS